MAYLQNDLTTESLIDLIRLDRSTAKTQTMFQVPTTLLGGMRKQAFELSERTGKQISWQTLARKAILDAFNGTTSTSSNNTNNNEHNGDNNGTH